LGDVVGHAFFNIKSSSSEDWNGPAFFYHHTYGLIKMWEPGLFPEFAYDVNDSGVVVGQLGKGGSDFYYPFRFESSGGGLHVMGDGRKGGAFGVNNLGDIVGEWYSGNDLSAFLYIRDENKEVDLNTRIPPNSGWLLQSAQRINDSKLIVGWGIRKGVPQPFLLRPLDEMPPWGFDLDKANLPMLTVFILFGVIGGGGGGGYTGGGNPVPIDPGPFRRLEPAVQDALVGLAIDQLARNIRDHGSRAQVRASALTNVENAIAGLKAGIKSEAEQQAKN
jgi:hypothetical protein